MNKILKSFQVDTSDMGAGGETRSISFKGDVGAKFSLQVISESTGFPKFFDFVNGGFQTTDFNIKSLKVIQLTSGSHTESITFPAATGTVYSLLILAHEDDTTRILNGKERSAVKKISQVANTTVTIQAASTSSSNYETFPTTTSTGSPGSSSNARVAISHAITNKDNDANGYGLRFVANHRSATNVTNISASLTDDVYYFETTEAVADNPAGDGEDSTTVTVASLTDLAVGMTLYYHKATTVPTNKAGSAVGTTTITAIDTVTKTITFSQAVAFEDTETMTFRAYGFRVISKAIGLFLSSKKNIASALGRKLTKTVRSAVSSSTTITLNGTRGVSGGNFLTYSGFGVNNSSTNTVTTNRTDGSTATASASAGEIIVTNAQTLTAGTVLTFDGCVNSFTFTHTLYISQYPSTNRTINIDLDRFITVGVQTA
tara:strand:+ start:1454 stop:2746 length:1293 start_codon:yes stop_codon:yes gene_type:complete